MTAPPTMPARGTDSKRLARTASQSGAASQSSSVMAMTSPPATLMATFRAPPRTTTISSQSPCVCAAMERAVAPTVSGRVAATHTEIFMPAPSTPDPLQPEAGVLLEAPPGGRADVAPVHQAVLHLVAAALGVGDVAALDL